MNIQEIEVKEIPAPDKSRPYFTLYRKWTICRLTNDHFLFVFLYNQIITRNVKDFQGSEIMALTPSELLARI